MMESSRFLAKRESFQTRIVSKVFSFFRARAIISLKAGRLAVRALCASSTNSRQTSQSRSPAYLRSALSWAAMDRSFSTCFSDDTRAYRTTLIGIPRFRS